MTHAGDLLSALLDGELSSDEEATVRAHVSECMTCAAELDEVTHVRSLLRGLPVLEPPSASPAAIPGRVIPLWRRPAVAGLAAAAVTVVLGIGAFALLQDDGAGTDPTVAVDLPGADAVPAGDPEMSDEERRDIIDETVDEMGMEEFAADDGSRGFRFEGQGTAVQAGSFRQVVDDDVVDDMDAMDEEPYAFYQPDGSIVFYCEHSWYRVWVPGSDADPTEAAMYFKEALGC